MTQQDNDGAFGDLFLDEGWYGVTTPGADLRTVRPLYAILPDGQMRVARLTPEEEAAQEARDPFERDPNPLADESAGESVAELVRVAYGYVVAREPLAVESPEAFAGPLPDSAAACWAQVRTLEWERERLTAATAHWPAAPRRRRLALRDARIRALLGRAAALGDATARDYLASQPEA